MTGPLDGLVVVDATWGLSTGLAGMLLADYGARVIKVERPGTVRASERAMRAFVDRSKWSVALDLDATDDQQRIRALLSQADVFIESFGPGGARARGLDHDTLAAEFPELVTVSFTGYGDVGPWANDPGFEALLNARMGMMAEQRAHRDGPTFLGHPTVSYGGAFMLVIGTLAALHARKQTGRGQHVDTSLLDGMLTIASMNWWWNEKDISYLARSGNVKGFGSKRLITDPFQCADGNWLIPHTGGPGSFKRMMDLLGFGDRIRAIDGPEMTVPLDADELVVARDLVPDAFRSRTRDEWVELFNDNDIACLPILAPHEVFDDPQVIHAGIVADIDDVELGPIRQVGPVIRFRDTPPAAPVRAPRVGEHQDKAFQVTRSAQWAPTGSAPIKHALQGVRIVDFSSFFATGFAAKLLGDLGADVVKVEPLRGDEMRPLGDLWEASQRGKEGISIDLRTAQGQEIAHRLVAEADVVMINFRPGKAEKVGLGYEQLREINPNIVYTYLPGFGSSGPKAGLKSFAPLQSGFAGVNLIASGAGNAPIRRAVGNEDLYNGFLGAISVLMGLVSRQNNGAGQYIESPQLHSSLFVRSEHGATKDGQPLGAFRLDADTTGWSPLYRLHRTRDGWIVIAAIGERAFAALATALSHPEWVSDERFATEQARFDNSDALTDVLVARFGELATAEAAAVLAAAGVPAEIPAEDPYMPELLWEEWATETGRVIEHHHPEYGWCREVGLTVRLSQTPGLVRAPSPMLGQHTVAVLTRLGYDAAQIDDMIAQHVARQAGPVPANA